MERHCALCLKPLVRKTIKLCGKCKRRSYCSRVCQKADWRGDGSQNHEFWCGHEYGEEDLDWKVAPVEGKGLGIVALRPFASKSRIMVEGEAPSNHPEIDNLMPVGGTQKDKRSLNALGCDGQRDSMLCLRLSRVNHSCNPNASHVYDSTTNTKVLFAERDIEPNEEIRITYVDWYQQPPSRYQLPFSRVLQEKWGIICPSDCACHSKKVEQHVRKVQKLDTDILRFGQVAAPVRAMSCIERLLELYKESSTSWITVMRTLHDGFQIGIMSEATMEQAFRYGQMEYDLACSILSPRANQAKRIEKYLQSPHTHRNYLLADNSIFKH